MAATIPYFQAMFTHDMIESKLEEVNMQGIEARFVISNNKTAVKIYLYHRQHFTVAI